MSAIEVLKGIKNTEIVVEDIAFNLQNEGYPHEEKDIIDALGEAIVALEKQENKVCIPLGKVRDLFVEMENYIDFSEGHYKRLRKKVGELKQQVYLETHKVRK